MGALGFEEGDEQQLAGYQLTGYSRITGSFGPIVQVGAYYEGELDAKVFYPTWVQNKNDFGMPKAAASTLKELLDVLRAFVRSIGKSWYEKRRLKEDIGASRKFLEELDAFRDRSKVVFPEGQEGDEYKEMEIERGWWDPRQHAPYWFKNHLSDYFKLM